MKYQYIRSRRGIFTIFILFIIEMLFIIVGNVLLGFPRFPNGNPVFIIQILIVGGIFLFWMVGCKDKDPSLNTILYGIGGLFLCLILVRESYGEWYILNGFFLFVVAIFVYVKSGPDYRTITSEDGIPSDDSRYISPDVKKAVWERDGGRCVICGSRRQLEYDHHIPFSKGGSNTERNIRILCKECNRKKTDRIE